MMYLADQSELQELRLKGGPNNRNFIGPANEPAGGPQDREITSFDDKGENDLAADGARQLLAEGATAIIGPLNTPQAVKMIPVVAESGRPHLFTATAAKKWTWNVPKIILRSYACRVLRCGYCLDVIRVHRRSSAASFIR
jgi:hypothetical protein